MLLSDSSRDARLTGKPADNIMPGSEYGLGLQIVGITAGSFPDDESMSELLRGIFGL